MNYRIKPTTRDFSNTKHIRLTTYHIQQKLLCLWFNITPSRFYTYAEAQIALMQHLMILLPTSWPSPPIKPERVAFPNGPRSRSVP